MNYDETISDFLELLKKFLSKDSQINYEELKQAIVNLEPAVEYKNSDDLTNIYQQIIAKLNNKIDTLPLLGVFYDTIINVLSTTKDYQLIDIYTEEAKDILESVSVYMNNLINDSTQQDPLRDMQRELHTLKGGARIIGELSVGELVESVEQMIKLIIEENHKINQEVIDVITEGLKLIDEAIEILANHQEQIDNFHYVKKVKNFSFLSDNNTADLAENTDDAEIIDDELKNIFIEEANDIFETMQLTLSKWESNLEDKQAIIDLQRELHTLKGGAKMITQEQISNATHELESFYDSIVNDKVQMTEDIYNFALEYHEHLAAMVNNLKNNEPIVSPDDKIKAVHAIVANDTISIKEFTTKTIESASNNLATETQAINDNIIQTEHIKVPAVTLDKLNNLSSESSIMRVNIEQQFYSINSKRLAMDSISKRLLEQIKKIGLEAETKISYKEDKQEKKRGKSLFDLLEMDRYSQLQTLTRMLTDTVSNLSSNLHSMNGSMKAIDGLLLQQSIINDNLKSNLIRTRLVSFSTIIPRLKRIAKQVSTELNKEINFEIISHDGEMDKTVLDNVVIAIEHMLRNSIDHGIEQADTRTKIGKTAKGNISLSLKREGAEVIITIRDDGSGIDVAAVKKKAIAMGMIAADTDISEREIYRCILQTGFSTRNTVTSISGRGVGLDIVNMRIKQLGGSVDIESKKDIGSKFTITIPFTLSVNKALIFLVCNNIYGIPLTNIIGICRATLNDINSYLTTENSVINYAGTDYQIGYLGSILNISNTPVADANTKVLPILLLKGSGFGFAVIVDKLLGSREVVIKSLGWQLSNVPSCQGATILGDGQVVIILDVIELGIKAHFNPSAETKVAIEDTAIPKERNDSVSLVTIMVVDDSLTVRKVTTNLLERHDYNVVQAVNGLDALNKIKINKPDLILLDIEMPEMDGLELTKILRSDELFSDIPIIMITSRTGHKHKRVANKLGVNEFMGKPYIAANLLDKIDKLLDK